LQQISGQFYVTRKEFSSSIALSTSFSGTWKKQRFIGFPYLLCYLTKIISFNIDLRIWPFPLHPIRPAFISSFCSMKWPGAFLLPIHLNTGPLQSCTLHRGRSCESYSSHPRTQHNNCGQVQMHNGQSKAQLSPLTIRPVHLP